MVDSHAFSINGQTGYVVIRKQLKVESLRLAYGLRNARFVSLNSLNKGSTAIIASPATDIYMIMESGMVHALPFHTERMLTTLCQAAAGIACALANPAWSASGLAHAVKVTGASHILAHPSAMLLVLETLQSMGHSLDEARR